MNSEIEAKFLDINHDEIRQKLIALGAQLEKPLRAMRRVTIDTPHMKAKDAFVRIRDEGDKVTITYKQFDQLSVDGAKEIEIIVSHFEESIALFAAAGLKHGSYQESKRETWRLGNAEIVLDTWPWLKPYIEIEGTDVKTVKSVAKSLGLAWNDAVFGDVMAAYRVQYPHLGMKDTVGNLAEVRFDDPLPDIFKID
jgi:adenylate cyclase class 2